MTLVLLCTSPAIISLDDYFHWNDAFISESEPHTNETSSVIMVSRWTDPTFGRSLERVFYHFRKQPFPEPNTHQILSLKNCIHSTPCWCSILTNFLNGQKAPMIWATLLTTISLRHIDGRPDRNSIPKMFDLPQTCFIILCFVLCSSLRECLLYCIFWEQLLLASACFVRQGSGRYPGIPVAQAFRDPWIGVRYKTFFVHHYFIIYFF